jgi:hypothetical protein
MRSTVRRGFDREAAGNRPSMHDSDGTFPDDVQVADAVEQQQPTADLAPEQEDPGNGVPLEVTASDWQEQREMVVIDSEIEAPEQCE